MLNLLRMNLFRMVHTKGVVVIFVLLMAFAVSNACMSAVESKEAMEWYEKDGQKAEGGDTARAMAGEDNSVGDTQAAEDKTGESGSEKDIQAAGDKAGEHGNEGDMQATGNVSGESGSEGNSQADGGNQEDGNIDSPGIAEDIEGDNVVYDIGYEMGQKGSSMGIYLETPLYTDGSMQDYLMLYGEELSSGLLLLFLLIAAVIFFWGDERNGFVKNIAGQTKHKSWIFLSKLIAIGIFTLVSMLCYMLVEFAAFKCGLLAGTHISFGMEHVWEACKVFATQYLLYMAFISGLLFLTEVTRSTAVGITIGLLGVLGFGIIFSALVQKIFHTDFQLVKYYVNTSVTAVNMYAGWDVFRLALWVGGGFLVIYNVLHMCWCIKRDVV